MVRKYQTKRAGKLSKTTEKAVAQIREKDSVIIKQARMTATAEMIKKIAHHWRQPLNVVSLVLSEVEAELEKSGKKLEFFEDGQKTIQELSTTIDDFGSLFDVDEKKEVYDVSLAIDKALKIVDGTMKELKIDIKTEAEGKDLKVFGNVNELSQILISILTNCQEAIEERIIENKSINLKLFTKNNFVYIQIEDNGGGISSEVMNRIFEPYFSTKGQGKGDGISLFISKQTVEKKMNGTLEVSNGKNGAIVKVGIPLV